MHFKVAADLLLLISNRPYYSFLFFFFTNHPHLLPFFLETIDQRIYSRPFRFVSEEIKARSTRCVVVMKLDSWTLFNFERHSEMPDVEYAKFTQEVR
jgi:hypothetical protein